MMSFGSSSSAWQPARIEELLLGFWHWQSLHARGFRSTLRCFSTNSLHVELEEFALALQAQSLLRAPRRVAK